MDHEVRNIGKLHEKTLLILYILAFLSDLTANISNICIDCEHSLMVWSTILVKISNVVSCSMRTSGRLPRACGHIVL